MTTTDYIVDRTIVIRLKQFGIVFGILSVFLTGLLVTAIFAHKKWDYTLKVQVQQVLDYAIPKTYIVEQRLNIRTPLSFSANAFKLTGGQDDIAYALIVRVQTIYGPVPSVFVYNKSGGTIFAGFIGIEDILGIETVRSCCSGQIAHWQQKATIIIKQILKRKPQ